MKRSAIFKLFRIEAESVARNVCRVMKHGRVPECRRISRRRGRAHFGDFCFSLPEWILYTHPAYRLWYIVHEVCHLVPWPRSHGPLFFRAEAEIMERWGWRIVRAERGPYIQEIRELETNWPVCDSHGRPV